METIKNKDITLRIADYHISISSSNIPFSLSESHMKFSILPQDKHDINITVEYGDIESSTKIQKIFEVKNNGSILWAIHFDGTNYHLVTGNEELNIYPYRSIVIDKQFKNWRIILDKKSHNETDNLIQYPIDAILLYYLSTFNNGCLIHASGVNSKNSGMIFSGISGQGKSTMAKIWYSNNNKIINDDRLIIREINGEYFMYNTPMPYYTQVPKKSKLDKILLIEHSKTNNAKHIDGTTALLQTMANCIHHPYNQENIDLLVNFIKKLTNKIPIYKLGFKPDNSIIDFIHEL